MFRLRACGVKSRTASRAGIRVRWLRSRESSRSWRGARRAGAECGHHHARKTPRGQVVRDSTSSTILLTGSFVAPTMFGTFHLNLFINQTFGINFRSVEKNIRILFLDIFLAVRRVRLGDQLLLIPPAHTKSHLPTCCSLSRTTFSRCGLRGSFVGQRCTRGALRGPW